MPSSPAKESRGLRVPKKREPRGEAMDNNNSLSIDNPRVEGTAPACVPLDLNEAEIIVGRQGLRSIQ